MSTELSLADARSGARPPNGEAPPAPDCVDHATRIERLTGIWTRILQVTPIFPGSNFFDLGGDSLLAVGLFLEIERETGRKFPVTTIYDAPTIAEQAALLESDSTPKFSPLVLLKPGDGRTPLFVVHGIGGTVMELSALGKQIQSDSPVYALQARGLDGTEPPLDTVEGMAAFYLDAIREEQPAGPYLLAGYSFGGLVAFEMARLLKQRQDNVALLFMVDAYAHPKTWPLRSRAAVRRRRLQSRLRLIAARPMGETVSYLAGLAKKLVPPAMRRKSADRSSAPKPALRWLKDLDPNLPLPLRQVRGAGEAALSSYVPQFYPGRITFLRAQTTDPVFPTDPKPIWRPLSQEFELFEAPGDHRTLIEQHAEIVANRISSCIAHALAPNDPKPGAPK
jgi:thioesterase domain-containing protein/acyl carrier protein